MNEIPETRFDQLLGALQTEGVDFIVVGGLAAIVHGSARATFDVDVVYARTPENIQKLVRALGPLRPYLRGAPPGLPFKFDEATVRFGLNFTLQTELGALDLLGEVAGGGTFAEVVRFSEEMEIFGRRCRVVNLEKLIQLKRAAGRPKDLEAIAELQALLEEKQRV